MILPYEPAKASSLGISFPSAVVALALDYKRATFQKVESLPIFAIEINFSPSMLTKAIKELSENGYVTKADGVYLTTPEWVSAYYSSEGSTDTGSFEEVTRYVDDLIRDHIGLKPNPPNKRLAKAKVNCIKKIMMQRPDMKNNMSKVETKKLQFKMILLAHKHWLEDDGMSMYFTIENMFSSVTKFDKKLAAARAKYKR